MNSVCQPEDTKSRLLAKLVRDLVTTEKFDTLADLTDALKARCAVLKIRWTADDINGAYALVGSNRPLVAEPVRRREYHERVEDDIRPLSRDEASDIWRRLTTAMQAQR